MNIKEFKKVLMRFQDFLELWPPHIAPVWLSSCLSVNCLNNTGLVFQYNEHCQGEWFTQNYKLLIDPNVLNKKLNNTYAISTTTGKLTTYINKKYETHLDLLYYL